MNNRRNVATLLEYRDIDVQGVVRPQGLELQGVQTLTGAGAVDLLSPITHLVTTGANALTLANGEDGQIKYIVMKTDGGDGTLTPANLGNGTTLTFDAAGESAHLIFTNGNWYFMGGTATLA